MAQTGNAHRRDDLRAYGNQHQHQRHTCVTQKIGTTPVQSKPATQQDMKPDPKKAKNLSITRSSWMKRNTIIPVLTGLGTGIGTFLAMRSVIGLGVGFAFFGVVWIAFRHDQKPKDKAQIQQETPTRATGISQVSTIDYEKHATAAMHSAINGLKAVITGGASTTRSIVRTYSYMDWTDLLEATIGLTLVLLTTIVPYALGWYAMDMAFYLILGMLVLCLLLVNVFDKDTNRLEWMLYISGVFAILAEPLLSLKYTYLVTVPGEHVAVIYTDQIYGFGAIATGSFVLFYQFVFRLAYKIIRERHVQTDKPEVQPHRGDRQMPTKETAVVKPTATAIEAQNGNLNDLKPPGKHATYDEPVWKAFVALLNGNLDLVEELHREILHVWGNHPQGEKGGLKLSTFITEKVRQNPALYGIAIPQEEAA